MKRTPGPWKYNQVKKSIMAFNGGSFDIAKSVENESNARLIAAAPELLDALLKLMDYTQQGYKVGETHPLEVAENAVRKATNLFSVQIKQ